MLKEYANRPSEPWKKLVRRSDGVMVPNIAYQPKAAPDKSGKAPRVALRKGSTPHSSDAEAVEFARKHLEQEYNREIPQPELDELRTAVNKAKARNGAIEKSDSDAGIAMLKRIADGQDGGTMGLHGEVPTCGFAFSPYPERCVVKKKEDFRAHHIKEYIEQNKDELGKKGRYLGYWVHEGEIYLDVSIVANDAEKAREMCKQSDQKDFFDIGMLQSCCVDRELKSGQG